MSTTPPSFDNDVFISYSHLDQEWARKLSASLAEKGVKSYLDEERLKGGETWELSLTTNVQKSQHLVVLWSDNAKDSDWVRREKGLFETISDPNISPEQAARRRLIHLNLKGEDKAFSSRQAINDIRDAAGAYDGGAAAVDDKLWRGVVAKVLEIVRDDDPSIPIPLVVLAMTQADAKALNPAAKPIWGSDLNTLLKTVGLRSKNNLLQHYGAERTDWKPFGHQQGVLDILQDLLDSINADAKKRGSAETYRWAPVDPRIWTDIDVAERERAVLLSTFSVIVIDPLSLYDTQVFDQLTRFSSCFNYDRTLALVLTPFKLPPQFGDLRALVQRRCTPFFDQFFDPPIPHPDSFASLGVNVGDENDIRRLLRASLGRSLRKTSAQSTQPEYLRQGSGAQ